MTAEPRQPGAFFARGLRWVSGDVWIVSKGMTAADYAESHGWPREAEIGLSPDDEVLDREPGTEAPPEAENDNPPAISDPTAAAEPMDIVHLAIGFDEGTLTIEELRQFALYLVETGMVNSTGTFQRFVRQMQEDGEI